MTKSILFLISFLFLFSCKKKTPATHKPYNIVWIVAEDLSPILPPYGDKTVETPHLSRLAVEGITYDRAFSPSGVCAPSRAALATGCYPTRIGANHMRTGPWFKPDASKSFVDKYRTEMESYGATIYQALPPQDVKMMSEVLRENGYYCTNNSKQDYQFRTGTMAWDGNSNKAHWRDRKDTLQPFFSVFNLFATHESQVWARMNDSLWIDKNLDVPVPPYLPTTDSSLQDIRRTYSNIKVMDAQVGEIITQLEEDDLLDNTVIWFYGDHGGPLPRQKRLTYDSGLRVPLIIRHPESYDDNTRNGDLVSFIDFAPTVMSIVGIKPQRNMDGQPFLGTYKREKEPEYIHAAADRFDETMDHVRAVRDKRYKYIKYLDTEKPMFLSVGYREQMPIMRELHRLNNAGKLTPAQALWFRKTKPTEELFDTAKDPHEIFNLAQDTMYNDIKNRLIVELDRWQSEVIDQNLKPEKELIDKLLPNGNTPTTHISYIIENDRYSISSETKGASLGYRINGVPSDSWIIYKQPVKKIEGDKLEFIADRLGYEPSDIVIIE